jgi:hypothetical protein
MNWPKKIIFGLLIAVILVCLMLLSVEVPTTYAITAASVYLLLIFVHRPSSKEIWPSYFPVIALVTGLILGGYKWIEYGSWHESYLSFLFMVGFWLTLGIVSYIGQMINQERKQSQTSRGDNV